MDLLLSVIALFLAYRIGALLYVSKLESENSELREKSIEAESKKRVHNKSMAELVERANKRFRDHNKKR